MDNNQELTLVQPSFSLTEQTSLSLLQAAINKAGELGIKATVSVVDASGRQLAFLKMAGVDSTGQCNIMHTGNYRGFQNAAASIKDQRADPSAEAGAMGSMEERPVA